MTGDTAPDVIFHNALVLTGEPPAAANAGSGRPTPTTVAVSGNRISAVGNDDVLAAREPGTDVIDLGGRTLMPGVNDGHIHIGGFALGRPPASLDVSPAACATVRQVAAAVAARAAELEPDRWITGRGWIGDSLSDLPGTEPWAGLLDEAAPANPVILTDFSGHAIWVNTAAMEAAGLSADTPVPQGGLMRRDGSGQPTGLFVDAAQALIVDHVPARSDDELEAAVRAGLSALHRQGITSITDAALSPFPGSVHSLGGYGVFRLLQSLCGRHDVPMRTNVLMTFSPLGASMLEPTLAGLERFFASDVATASDPAWFTVRGLKVFADGVPPSCTAWMSAPYPDGSHGCLTVGGDTDADRIDELKAIIATGHNRGLQVGVHATGDLTANAVVDGFAEAMANNPRNDPRHYVIHGPLAPPDLVTRAGALGVGFNVQPSLKSTSARAIEGLFGRELSEWQWPLRAIVDSGSPMAASSDAPVCDPNWRHGIASALLRETADGEVYGADQRITATEAVHAYTAAGAWQDGAETWKGTVEVGKVADLCVVDARLTTDDPRTLPSADVALTMVDGIVVHRSSTMHT